MYRLGNNHYSNYGTMKSIIKMYFKIFENDNVANLNNEKRYFPTHLVSTCHIKVITKIFRRALEWKKRSE